jgi:hypothetical protein
VNSFPLSCGMEFGISGRAIKEGSSSGVKLPSIVNKNNVGQPETSPRVVAVTSARRRPSGGAKRTNSANSDNGDLPSRTRDEGPQMSSKPNGKPPLKMQRAKFWSLDVENLFRYQAAGFRDHEEYVSAYPPPECWECSGFVKTLQAKQTGYFMYFRQNRECEDRHLNKVKMYSYGDR